MDHIPPSVHGPRASRTLAAPMPVGLAPPRRSSTHGRAPTGVNPTTEVRLTTPPVFPTSLISPPTPNPTHRPSSPTQLPRPQVCAPHRRMLDVSLVPVQEPRKRSR